jgi:sulfatase modifying factor 1
MMMKHLTLVVATIAISFSAHSQNSGYDIKATQKTLTKTTDDLYASKFEVTNKQYTHFLTQLKENNQADKYEIAKIDTAQWSKQLTYGKPFAENYHSHPAYANYPVVNISYDGATLFCEWLTQQYNASPKRKFHKVLFRLPTEKEWIMAAQGGNPSAKYPWKSDALKNNKNQYNCNLNENMMTDNADLTAPVNSYTPNEFGIYNMSGNVAEMLSENGRTKGGSWKDSEEYIKIDGPDKYVGFDTPKPTIGFRYFMEVIEK